MSGIYGVWHPRQENFPNKQDIERLMLWNKAYGEETEELYQDKDICCGCYCEKLSENAVQSAPVIVKDGIRAVIDAVLYNREELIEAGNFSKELSDEELLIDFVAKFGLDQLKEVNGDFAGAIFDLKKKKLILFRDHMGIRPLFYYCNGQSVAFSTDIRGLLAMEWVENSVDEQWFFNRVTESGVLGTETTEFAKIFCVQPASYMECSYENQSILFTKNAYWSLGSKKIRFASEEDYITKLRELITDSVQRRLNAVSGLVGAELSGGLDSGVIDILINRLGRECTYFSWSASPEELPMAENDERLVIEDICNQEKISCDYCGFKINYNDDSIISQKMKQIGFDLAYNESAYLMYVFPPYINTLQISASAQFINKCGAKVVFTGHGGDEGVSHRCNAYELLHHKEFIPYIKYMWSLTKDKKYRILRTVKACAKNILITRKHLTNPYVGVFAAKDVLKKDFYEKYVDECQASLKFAYDPVSYVKEGGSRNRLDVVALLGGYSGVRYLMPYLDYRVIDYAVSIPRHMYLKKGKNRYIFREAFKDIMPESLYKVNCKEDKSWTNHEKSPVKEDAYLERKKRAVDMVDRKYWDDFLDWNVLEQWAAQERTDASELHDKGIFMCLSNCIQIQNVTSRSRKIKKI